MELATSNLDRLDLTNRVTLSNSTPVFMGNYSYVYKGTFDGQIVAVKVIKLSGEPHSMQRKLLREKLIWASLDHQNIHPFYGFANDEGFAPFGALVSPWCTQGDASTFMKERGIQMPEGERIKLWGGVVDGVTYLHLHDPAIVHGDLKPGNVLIDGSGRPRICDFGLSRLFLDEEGTGLTTTSEHTGTERYLAPELVMSESTVYPTAESDVYALGCLGLEKPYSRRKNNLRGQIIIDLRAGSPPAIDPPKPWTQLWILLQSCWSRDPARRPSAIIVSQTLNTPPKDFPIAVLERIVYFAADKRAYIYLNTKSTWINRYQALNRLCIVSRAWWAITTPYIYRDICLWASKYSGFAGLDMLARSLASCTTMPESGSYGHMIQSLTLNIGAVYYNPNFSGQLVGNAFMDLTGITRYTPALRRLEVIEYSVKEHYNAPYVPPLYSRFFNSSMAAYLYGIRSKTLSTCLPNLHLLAGLQSLHIILLDLGHLQLDASGQHLPGLRHLTIRNLNDKDVYGHSMFIKLLSFCGHWDMPYLASLSIVWKGRSTYGFWPAAQDLIRSRGANLEHLTLGFCDRSEVSLTKVLPHCIKLKSIVFIGYDSFIPPQSVWHESLAHITYIWRHGEDFPSNIEQSMLLDIKRKAHMQLPSLKELMIEFRQRSNLSDRGDNPTSSVYLRTDEKSFDHWDGHTVRRYVEGSTEPLIINSRRPLSLSVPYCMQVPESHRSCMPWSF